MENRVGDNMPTEAERAALLQKAQEVKEGLEPWCITYAEGERQSRLKPLRGAELRIRKVYDLCKQHGISIPKVPLEGMLNDLNLFLALTGFVTVLKSSAKKAEDTQDQAYSESWEAFLAYYGALWTAAQHDADLAAQLADVVEFMAHYASKKPKAQKPATPAATPAATQAATPAPATTGASQSTTATPAAPPAGGTGNAKPG